MQVMGGLAPRLIFVYLRAHVTSWTPIVGWPGTQFWIVIQRQMSQTFNAESECWDHPFLET